MKNLILVSLMFMVSCAGLKTREDTAIRTLKRESVDINQIRKENADLKAANLEYEERFRLLSGKVEELEIINNRLEASKAKMAGEDSQELQAYKDSVSELVQEKKKLEQQLALLKEENKLAKQAVVNAKKTDQEHLDKADGYFDDKRWTEAVTEYQNYREKAKNKNSEDYALVTYKIGVCFQELGMVDEAKTFYQSVVTKNKNTKAAKYASYRLAQFK